MFTITIMNAYALPANLTNCFITEKNTHEHNFELYYILGHCLFLALVIVKLGRRKLKRERRWCEILKILLHESVRINGASIKQLISVCLFKEIYLKAMPIYNMV